jgi:signal transduction histidine kinase
MKTPTFSSDHQKNESNNTNRSLLHQETSSLPVRSVLINSKGDIVAADNAWRSLAEATGADWRRIGEGANYLEVCRSSSAVCSDAASALTGISAVLAQTVPDFSMDYRCHTPSGWRRFRMAVTAIAYGNARAYVTHIDVTPLVLSGDTKAKLVKQDFRRAINAQEEERRRISQEVHDDLGNRVALLALSAHQIIKENVQNSDSTGKQRKQFFDRITDLSNALRDLSHSLHPPLLRYVGIKGEVVTLLANFQKAHRIPVNLVIPVEPPRLSEEVALCVFRVAQECLQNIAKHSGANRATVALRCVDGSVRLSVSDTGRGFIRSDAIKKSGIGLSGMESRAVSLGGRLMVNTSPGAGTEVVLTIPL